MSSFTGIMTVEKAISRKKMSKTFFKKLLETTQIMGGLAVMIAVEKEF